MLFHHYWPCGTTRRSTPAKNMPQTYFLNAPTLFILCPGKRKTKPIRKGYTLFFEVTAGKDFPEIQHVAKGAINKLKFIHSGCIHFGRDTMMRSGYSKGLFLNTRSKSKQVNSFRRIG